MGKVVAVLSGKGGTGKTTVCAGLAAGLAAQGCRVLCIDLDVGLRNLDIALGLSQVPALSFQDVSEEGADLTAAAQHPVYETLFFLTAPVGRRPEELDRAAFDRMMEAARQSFDFCLLDAPAGVGAGFQLAARAASLEVLVTGRDPGALRDGARTGEILELMGKEDVRLVVNRVDARLYRSLHLTVDDVMDWVGYPLLGLVPEDRNVMLAAVHDRPVLLYARRCAAAKAFRRMAKRLQGLPVPLAGL